MTVEDMSKRRPPVCYTVEITHHWDGTIEAFVHDVSDSPRSREAVIYALERVLEKWRQVAEEGKP